MPTSKAIETHLHASLGLPSGRPPMESQRHLTSKAVSLRFLCCSKFCQLFLQLHQACLELSVPFLCRGKICLGRRVPVGAGANASRMAERQPRGAALLIQGIFFDGVECTWGEWDFRDAGAPPLSAKCLRQSWHHHRRTGLQELLLDKWPWVLLWLPLSLQ